MTDLDLTLKHLGDALEQAADAQLSATRPRRLRLRKRVVVAAIALAIAVPGIAIGAAALIHPDDVARSLPAGTLALAGTDPTCTVVEADVEYHCTLENAPRPDVSDWTGTVEPSVDATKHVNGGCRSLRADGREWECYIGQAAVDQRIIGQDFLGEYAPSPGVG
jgi:hypothetical protein